MHGEKSVVNQVPDFHVAKGDAPPAFETRIGLACPRDPSSAGLRGVNAEPKDQYADSE